LRQVSKKTQENAEKGKVRYAEYYHGRLTGQIEHDILVSPDGIYVSPNGNFTLYKDGDVVITSGGGSAGSMTFLMALSISPARLRRYF
jgi:hypothetical protein